MGVGTTTPNAKAALDISATDKGLLIPRLTQTQRLAITSPPNGLMVFQTDNTTGFWYYFGGSWVNIPNANTAGDDLGNHTATQNLDLANNQLVGNGGSSGLGIGSTGNVGIGVTPGATRLAVVGTDATANGLGAGISISNIAAGGNAWLLRSGATGSTTGAGNFSIANSAGYYFNINGNGNVGIGVSNPSRLLDVNGSVRLRGLTTAGVVTTDASGNLASEANQTLNVSGQTLSISGTGGNSVTLPSSGGSPSGAAGGVLSGTYPNPGLAANAVTNAAVADDAVGIAELSATGTASATTYLRGDNTWATLPASTAWSLSGNNTSGAEFIGTNNNQDFVVKRNGAEAFRVLGNGRVTLGNNTYGSLSLMLGFNAGAAFNTGSTDNTHARAVFVGSKAGETNNADGNTFVGYAAGQKSIGSTNTLIGDLAGSRMTNGDNNVFIGSSAVYNAALTPTGSNNVVIGASSGAGLTNNQNNILLGGNTAVGAGLYDAYVIGNSASVTQGNSLAIGNERGTNDAISVGIGTAAPSSSLQVNGTFAVGVVTSFGGGTNSSPNGLDQGAISSTNIIGGYYGLAPANTSSQYYSLPSPSSCPGRIYYLRNTSTNVNALITTDSGTIYAGSGTAATLPYTLYSNPNSSQGKTVIAISDGTNWTIGKLE